MSQRLIILDEAEDELIEAEKWYERQRSGDLLVKAPLSASPITNLSTPAAARQVFVKRFPYSIIFIEHEDDLWVVAFAHQRRRPGYWRGRLQS